MSKFTVKTELSNIIQMNDGTFSYKEDIVSMHWTTPIKRSRKEPLTKEEIEWRQRQLQAMTNKEKSPRKEKKKTKKPK